MDIDRLRQGFTYLLVERVNLAWQPSLFADGLVNAPASESVVN